MYMKFLLVFASKIILCLSLLILVTPVAAALPPGITPPSCTLTGDVVVNFLDPETSVRVDVGSQHETPFSSLSLNPGTYQITVQVWDFHNWQSVFEPNNLNQPKEQVFLELYSGTALRYTTNETEDLVSTADDLNSQVEASLEITTSINRLRAVHLLPAGPGNPNSIHPICVAFEAVATEANVQGTVIQDFDGTASLSGSYCSDSDTTGFNPGSNSDMLLDGSGNTINSNGTYGPLTITSDTAHLLTLDFDGSTGWTCTCPSTCRYNVNLSSGSTQTANFYVSNVKQDWFQISNGDIHVENLSGDSAAISNQIPLSCSGSCKAYATIRDASDTIDTSGLISFGQGTVDLSESQGLQYDQNASEDANDRLVQSSYFLNNSALRQGYDFFYRLAEFELNPSSDFSAPGNNPSNVTKPSSPPLSASGAYYSDEDLTIDNTSWQITSGESIVVFVDGNLTIDGSADATDLITVENGGYLAFIVSGNITFTDTVGVSDASSTDTVVEGVFLADAGITVAGTGSGGDLKFIGAGTFVGWNGVSFNRSFGSSASNLNPTVSINFRPDFVVNTPSSLRTRIYSWQEVAP